MITGVFRSVFDRHILIGRASSGFRRLLKLRNAALLSMVAVLVCGPFSRGVWAATYTATSCSAAAFNAALSSATDGDTVQGPSGGGTATWAATDGLVQVTKGITLNGNGCVINFTNVSASNNGVLALFPDSAAVLTVTGFTFNNGFTNGQYPVGINLPTTTPYAQPVRIYNVTFNTNGAGGTMLNTNGIGPYLIDHNTFNTNVDAAELMHLNGPGNDNVDVVPGSENMGIIENNTCVSSNPSSIYSQFEESFNGAAYTLRYNQWTGCQLDAHAGNGAGGPGGRWWEIYGNQYNQCCASGSKFDSRGGTGVFWDNTQINDPNDADIGLGPLADRATTLDLTLLRTSSEWESDGTSITAQLTSGAAGAGTVDELSQPDHRPSPRSAAPLQ